MPNAPTPVLGMILPTVGGDAGAWGTELNTALSTCVDPVGAANIINTSVSVAVVPGKAVQTIIRVTVGTGTPTITLPDPATCTGKIFTTKIIDSGAGSCTVAPAVGTIDGQASWALSGQYSDVSAMSSGTGYDVL